MTKERGAVRLGYDSDDRPAGGVIDADARVLLAQEIRHARGGRYTLTVRAGGRASTPDEFEQTFLAHFRCRLVLFRFQDMRKDPRAVGELASVEFRPSHDKQEAFVLDRFLGSTTPGANFAIGSGLGVLIAVEKKTPGRLVLPADEPRHAGLRVTSVTLDFHPRQRDESVTV